MTGEERHVYAINRIETAYKTLEAAKLLIDYGHNNSAINRLYYSVFYAVNALLVVNGINPQSHSGVKSQFSLYFIKTGKLDIKFGKLLARLYDWRQLGDYENLFDFDSETVSGLFEPVTEMIQLIEIEIVKNK